MNLQGLFCDHAVQLPTSLWDAVGCTGILPRTKKASTGHFFAHPMGGPLSSNPVIARKKKHS